jgi:hypothetical protein
MDYKELPLEERIQLASQYALLLTADVKSNEEIIGILKADYALTDEQAVQAFASMSSDYKAEYNSTVRGNFLKALGLIGVSLAAFLFYYFMGKEMGSLGILAGILAFFCGTSALGAVVLLGRIVWDKLNLLIVKKGRPGGTVSIGYDQFDKMMGTFVFISFFLLCLFSYEYFSNAGIVDENNIATIHNCIVTQPVRYENTGGKSRSYYYTFKFKGSDLEFNFFDRYYKYAKDVSLISTLKKGDTVSVQIEKADLPKTNDPTVSGRINLVNLAINNVFFIDHAYRNARVSKSNKISFYVLLAAFSVIVLVLLLKKLYQYLHYRK